MPNCPSQDQLSGYVRGTLTEPAATAIADHVEHCSPCEATVTRLEGETSRMVKALRRPAADSYAAEPQLAKALARAAEPPASRQETPLPGPASSASISAAPGTVSIEAMIARMDESGIVPAAEARAFVAQRRPVDGKALAAELVAAGRLTKFQANLLYHDRAKELIYGEYLIAEKIGAGGMGQVFRAEHRLMKRPVAIKLIRAKALGKDEAVKRFQREVQAAAKLNHPNIVTAHDAGEKAGVHFLVMELVAGDDLGAVVKKRGALPIAEAVGLVVQAGRGLAYAHGKGVVHRDIKPSNLLLDADGTVKVLDLGLARMANVGTEEGLTQTGQVMGTVDYMAPEQAIDTRSADARSDIYSLGCTLWKLLTNQNVFAGESLGAKLLAHAQQPPPSLRAARPDAPDALDRALQKMLAKQPEHRYQTMAECLAALEAALKPGARPLPVAKALPENGPAPTQPVAPAFSFAPAPPPVAPPSVSIPAGQPVAESPAPLVRTSPLLGGGRGGVNPLFLWGGLGGAAVLLIVGVVIIIRNMDGSQTEITADGPVNIKVTPGSIPPKGTPTPPAVLPKKPLDFLGSGQPGKPVVVAPTLFVQSPTTGFVFCSALSSNGKYLATGCSAASRIWDAETGKLLHELDVGGTATPRVLAFSPDNKLFAWGGWSYQIYIFNVETGKQVHRLPDSPSIVMSLAFSPDSTKLLSGSRGQKVGNGFQFGAAPSSRVWDVKSGTLLKQYDGNPAGLGGCWLADRKRAVARNSNQTAVVVWDTETGKEISALDRDLPAIEHLALSAGDKYVAAGLGNNVVMVWDMAQSKRIHRFEPAGVPAFTPDATRLVCSTASHGPLARVFDLASGGEIAKTEQRLADNVGHSWVFPAGDRAVLSTYQSAHVYTIPLPGASTISASPPANPLPAGSVVYLDDLQEASWEGAALAKHGMRAASDAGWSHQAMSWLGRKPAHSLFTHPQSYSSAWLTYALDGRYDEFRATIGVLAKPTSQLVFCVYGDDIRLWQSPGLTEAQKGTEFTVKVRGVKTLKLEIHCPSAFTNAQAVWIDPRLTVAAPPSVP